MVRFLFAGLFVISFHFGYAQINDIKFKHLSVQDGLSRSWVKCIHQDSYGFMWFGTGDGLNRYDGYTFKVYKNHANNPNSINNNNINIIYEDKQGRLWIGTQEGLNIYNRDDNTFIPLDVIDNFIDCIYEFDDGQLLIGSPGGLFLVNPEDLSVNQIFNNIYVDAILMDKNENLWLGTYNGLRLLNTSDYSYTDFTHDDSDPSSIGDNIIRSLYQDSYGNIWIGTNSGLVRMNYTDDPAQPEFILLKHDPRNSQSISMGAVLTIAEDNDKNLWIGIENGGLNILELQELSPKNTSFHHYTYIYYDNTSLSNNSVHCIYLDAQNTIWLGTYGGGLSYYNKLLQKFRHYKSIPGNSNSLNNNHVNVIYEDGNYLWLGTEGGLNMMDKRNNSVRHYTFDPNDNASISSNAVWSIFKDSNENLWIGTWAGGLNLFNPETETFTRYLNHNDIGNSLGGYSVYGFLEDRENDLWIASMGGGLYNYNHRTGKYKRYVNDPKRNSVSNDWIFTLMESSYGEIWISTTTAVDLFNKKSGKFITFTHSNSDSTSINYNGAIVLFEDSKKNIWLGTSSGLDVFRRADSTFIHYTIDDGLPNNTIKGICEDEHGNLWLSTNNGLSKFKDAIHQPVKPKFINYDMSDGLQGNEFNSRSFCKGIDGTMYFGGTNGFNAFHPDSIKDNKYTPVVRLTDFYIFNKPVDIAEEKSPLKKHIGLTEEVILNRKHSVFSIEYAALNYIAPEKNTYAYMLEGFDKEWNYVGTKRIATYTNLDPGHYIFKVKASNNNGLWNENYTSVSIRVLPPWWNTWFAKSFYILLGIIALYFFRKYTIISVNFKNKLWIDHIEKEKSEELNRLKLQFFTNISHELRTPLTLIIGPLNRLLNKGRSTKELDLIRSNVLRLRNLVDQILDFRKIDNRMMKLKLERINMVEFIRCVVFQFNDFGQQKSIQLFFKSNIKELYSELDVDKMEKIMSNLLSNAIKYTSEHGTVTVFMDVINKQNDRGENVIIKLSDTGVGIAKEDLESIFDRFYTSQGYEDHTIGTGIGLHLTKRLVEMHGGNISVKSEPGEGSTFTITIPVKIGEGEVYQGDGRVKDENTEYSIDTHLVRNDIQPSLHDKTILIVDDNDEMCEYLESTLQDDFKVITVNNPLRCIDLTLEHMPDIIISDVIMPKLNGFDLCRQLKTDIRFSHIPVILLTAKATTEDHIAGLETGADEYLYKPFDENLLISRVKNLIRQREQLRQHFIGSDGKVNEGSEAHSLDKSFMDKVIQAIRENYKDTEFSVHTIIEASGMSRSVFYKKFKALSHFPINDLIKNYRLKKAEELLFHDGLSVSEVAYATGFSDPAYFSKVFKEFYKISPKDFKKISK